MEISIIIPIYNVEKYIIQCLSSVFKQDLQDFEIICVDDCGTDKSIKLVEEYSQKHNYLDVIKIVKHENNQGLSEARNTGIKYASGEYCYFLDGDDILKENTLCKMYQIAKDKKLDILEGGFCEFYETNYNIKIDTKFEVKSTKTMSGLEFLTWGLRVKEYIPMACGKLYNTGMIKKSEGFMTGLISEDEEFTPRIYIQANKIARCNICSYLYRRRDGSITTSYNNTRWIDSYIVIAERLLLLSKNDKMSKQAKKYILQRRAQIVLSLFKNIFAYDVDPEIAQYAIQQIRKKKLQVVPLRSPFMKEKIEGVLFFFPSIYGYIYRSIKNDKR